MKVKFLPDEKEIEIKPNQSVLELAHDNDIHIQSVCKGVPSCAECRIQVKDGDHNLIPPGPKELALIGTAYFVDNSRLACQMRCFGDVVVDLTQQIEKEKRVKDGRRPKGRLAKDMGESKAVTGNVMLEDGGRYSDTDEKIAERLMIEEQIKLARSRRGLDKGDGNHDGPTSETKSSEDATAGEDSSKQANDSRSLDSSEKKSSDNGRDKKRRRNRNRNRNKNRKKKDG